MPKVLSITAAIPGWVAKFENDGDKYEQPVVLCALVQDDTDPSLQWPASYSIGSDDGRMAMQETDDEIPGFAGYEYRGADSLPR